MSQNYTIARITREGEHFEILVQPEPAFSYRTGKTDSLAKVLVSDTIFTDANKGIRASEDQLQGAFGTLDSLKIASAILKKGTLQLTTDQRRKLTETKRKQIISFITRQCIDPKTNLPHPPMRIEQALGQVHYSIDPFGDVEEQAKEVIKLLRPILPLKMENVSVTVRIPPEYAAKVYGTVKGYGTIRKEEWRSDGSWFSTVEMPAGLYGPFLEKLGEMTKGNLEAKLIK
ncbi:MAG: ribosome assembly factor SBDS [Candidatus Bathyarchaeota archaeon]|nr:MAG: ribosome assembly factor SBDS [Candidatus Bathyarchaeota archaeon]